MLGLIITGGTDSLLDGVYIQKIIPGSPADKDGRLKPGDKILKINNSSMEGVPRDEALRALQQSSSFVHITIVRDPNSAPTMPPYKEEGMCSDSNNSSFMHVMPILSIVLYMDIIRVCVVVA